MYIRFIWVYDLQNTHARTKHKRWPSRDLFPVFILPVPVHADAALKTLYFLEARYSQLARRVHEYPWLDLAWLESLLTRSHEGMKLPELILESFLPCPSRAGMLARSKWLSFILVESPIPNWLERSMSNNFLRVWVLPLRRRARTYQFST